MTAQERLIIYNKALKDYKRANSWWRWLFMNSRHTMEGFCTYFNNTGITNNLRDLKELWGLYSKAEECSIQGIYWYFAGYLPPRIELLEKAIEECKLNIYKELEIIKV